MNQEALDENVDRADGREERHGIRIVLQQQLHVRKERGGVQSLGSPQEQPKRALNVGRTGSSPPIAAGPVDEKCSARDCTESRWGVLRSAVSRCHAREEEHGGGMGGGRSFPFYSLALLCSAMRSIYIALLSSPLF